jgi:hypothetical protein
MTEADRYLAEKQRRAHTTAHPDQAAASPSHAGGPSRTPSSAPTPAGTLPAWFTCEGRLPRMAYFLRMLAIFPIALFGFGLVGATPVLGLPLIILTEILLIPQSAKRLHDMNQSGWLQLLCIIPFVHLWLLFGPGTEGPNQYGSQPR